MYAYLIRRILLIIPTLLIVSLLTFFLVNLMPGDVLLARLQESASFREEDLQALREQLGLDKPLWEQYLNWLGDVLRGDFGTSLWTSRSIVSELGDRLPVTIEIALLSIFFSTTVGITIGVISATRQNSLLDYILRFVSIAGLSLPNFWLATLFIIYSSVWFNYLPPLNYVPFTDDPLTNLQQFLPPSIIIGIALSATMMRMTRSSMLEVMRQDYIRTAWAKGFGERIVVMRHGLKNALIPVLTIAGTQFGAVMGGSVIVEQVFNLPGIGKLLLESVNQRDFTMIQGVTLFFGVVFVVINLVVDLTYGWLDPRIRR